MIDNIRAIIAMWFMALAMFIHEDTVFDIVDRANASVKGDGQ